MLFLILAALAAWGVWLIVLFGFIIHGQDTNPALYWSVFAIGVLIVAAVLWAATAVGRPFLGRLTNRDAKPSQ